MTDTNPKLDTFLDRILARPLPQNGMARVRVLARELAEGAAEGVWYANIAQFRGAINETAILYYRWRRWDQAPADEARAYAADRREYDGVAPSIELLFSNGYLQASDVSPNYYQITRAAFDLIDEVEPASIFISYRRKDSSAFALLALARLKAEGLEPFLDLALEPGEDWRAGLRDRIRRFDTLIVLLGPETLTSKVVIQELEWALEADLAIIPIWHGGFHLRAEDWSTVPAAIVEALSTRHTIRVLEESPLAYNNAIVELLNRFGVTPG